MTRIFALAPLAVLLAAPAHADWKLANDTSRVSFVTTKAGQIAEAHTFHSLSGMIDGSGNVTVDIDLTSVDTMIPVRDERMREVLFQTGQFPKATLTAKVDADAIADMRDGQAHEMSVDGMLAMHGKTLPVTLDVLVSKLRRTRIVVATMKPVIVTAAQLDLADGVEELRNLAGLPSISPAVPVSVVLTFDESL